MRRFPVRKKGSDRYGVERIQAHGESYRSGLEVEIHGSLLLQNRAGELEVVKREDHVRLGPAKFLYIPDFKCRALKAISFKGNAIEAGEVFWVEAKGKETETWRRNYRLWKICGPGKLVIYRGCQSRYVLSEVLVPRGDVCVTCGRSLFEASK